MLRHWFYHNFRALYRFDQRLRRRLTAPGQLVFCSMIAAAVIGIDTRLNLASQIAALLACLLLIAMLSTLFFRPKLRVQRQLPPLATAGQPLRYRVRIENRGTRLQPGLYLLDRLAETWPTFEEYRYRRDPADKRRNFFDRYVGYPRWLWLLYQKRGANEPSSALPPIPAGGSIDIELTLQPRRRGHVYFQGCTIARPDPFGLINALHRIPEAGTLLVLPKRYPMAHLALPGGRLYQPGGLLLAGARGDAQEFYALRDYRPGDSPRDIHWKSWAKTGKPIVQEKRPEYFARYALILDTFIPAGGETLFEEAVAVAASLLSTLETGDVLLDLLFVGPKTYRFTAGRGLHSQAQLLRILACAEGVYEQPFAQLHNAVLHQAEQFSGCLGIFLAWDADRQRLAQALRAREVDTRIWTLTQGSETPVSADYTALPVERLAETLASLSPAGRQ